MYAYDVFDIRFHNFPDLLEIEQTDEEGKYINDFDANEK